MEKNHTKNVQKYYKHFGARLGYNYVMRGSQHFGYHPVDGSTIDEWEAQRRYNDLLAKKLSCKKGDVVLDAGCGQGFVGCFLAKNYDLNVTGISIVDHEIKRSIKRSKKEKVDSKTNFLVMDYSTTEFKDNYFDAVYTTETLSHSPDVSATLKEFKRILKPGGKIVLFEYTIAPRKDFDEHDLKIFDLVVEGSSMSGLVSFEHGKFPALLKKVGFDEIKDQEITENIRPSLYRLHKILKTPYKFVKFFGLQKHFINTTVGGEFYAIGDKGLIKYQIFTARKPL